MTGPTCLNDFVGDWTIDRQITQHSGGPDGHFTGLALFSKQEETLHYSEKGRIRMGDGASMKATRAYLWHSTATGVRITFDDGRPFHDIDFAAPKALHDCPPDIYRVAYDFSDWPHWQAVWHVTGPRKDYTMCSRYAPTSSVITFEDRSSVR